MIFSHFQITFQQAGNCISPVTLRTRGENAHLLVNPIPKLTIVLIWETPPCLKFGKTSNRAEKNCHKENSESEQRTMHVLIRIWSHRTSASVRFSGTIDLRTLEFGLASTRCPSTTSERVTNLHIQVPEITHSFIHSFIHSFTHFTLPLTRNTTTVYRNTLKIIQWNLY